MATSYNIKGVKCLSEHRTQFSTVIETDQIVNEQTDNDKINCLN